MKIPKKSKIFLGSEFNRDLADAPRCPVCNRLQGSELCRCKEEADNS